MEVREFVRVITRKGQVTIPAEVRRLLGIKPNEHVVFSIRDGQVVVTAAHETLASVYGAVEPLSRPEDLAAARAGH